MPEIKAKGSGSVSVKRQVKAPSKKLPVTKSPTIKVSVPGKRVEKGKMNIDTAQMIKDLVELGRIKDEKKEHVKNKVSHKKTVSPFMDLSNSPLINFIQEKNHGSYFKVALVFLSIVILFFLSILYVINSKAVINVVLKKADSSTQIQRTFNVYDVSELSKDNSSAIVVSVPVDVNVEDSYAISTQVVKTTKAEGKIKIINNTAQPQGLVASTRFVSDATGDLYRLKDTVNIPANSSVEAYVYADKETANGENAGIRFTIPGLKSDAVRQLIYGESITNINFDGVAKAVVTQDDMTQAESVLEGKLKQAAMNALQDKVSNYTNFSILPDSFDFKIASTSLNGVKVGNEVDGIKISGKASATALFVSKDKLLDVIKSSILSQNVSSNVVNIKESTLSYDLSKMDLINKLASLNISVDNYVSYDIDQMLNREDIAGMNINDFYVYVQDKNFASRVQVISYPFWSKNLPKIANNIIIKVK